MSDQDRTHMTARELAEEGIRAARLVIENATDPKAIQAAREILDLGVDGVEQSLIDGVDEGGDQ